VRLIHEVHQPLELFRGDEWLLPFLVHNLGAGDLHGQEWILDEQVITHRAPEHCREYLFDFQYSVPTQLRAAQAGEILLQGQRTQVPQRHVSKCWHQVLSQGDRKSTRLNSSHLVSSYPV